MARIVVVTGGSAGVGRATAREFARQGWDVAVIARGQERLDETAAELRGMGVRALAISADVADAAAIEAAAERVERELGPIEAWINNAMSTVFAPVMEVTPEEFRRGTEVTYLGTVHGTVAALRRMRKRRRGTIINVGSALVYRSVPLQAVYCASKAAIRGFTDSLRSELLHDRANIHLGMVHLPAVNTPQFDWALNKMGRVAQPVPPIYQPEVPARAIVFAATHDRREIWVGLPTVVAILANRIAPSFADWYLARHGYSTQMGQAPKPPSAPDNLFQPVSGHQAAHGRFDHLARNTSWEMFTTYHKGAVLAVAGVGLVAGLHLLAKRLRI